LGNNVLNLTELIMLSLATTVLCKALAARIGHMQSTLRSFPLLENARELASTTAFLGSTVTIQLSIQLIRDSVFGPTARVLTVVSALLLMKTIISSVSVGQRVDGRVD